MKLYNGLIIFEKGENPFKLFKYPKLSQKAISPYGFKLIPTSGSKDPFDLSWIEASEDDYRTIAAKFHNIIKDDVKLPIGCYLDSSTGKCVENASCEIPDTECAGPLLDNGVLVCLCSGISIKKKSRVK
jgi:hypothetical protein